MAIQNRRGYEADFDPAKMLPGEWAVSLDTKYVRMCFAPGECLRMATYEGFEQDMEEVRRILAECQDIQAAIEQIWNNISDTELVIENYVSEAKKYRDEAKQYRDEAEAFTPEGYADLVQNVADNTVKIDTIIEKAELNIKNTTTGNNIHLTDSADSKVVAFGLYGKAEQKQYSGKNLLPNTAITATKGGITFTVNENGSVTTNGTLTSTPNSFEISDSASWNLIDGENYLVSGANGTSNSHQCIGIYNMTDNVTVLEQQAGIDKIFTYDASKEYRLRITLRGEGETHNLTFYPMIRLASIADSTYEPYVGGIPSPNPSYPQDIEVAGASGSVEVKSCGKNRINYKEIASTWYKPSTSSVYRKVFTLKPNTQYTLSCDVTSSLGAFCFVVSGDNLNFLPSTANNGAYHSRSVITDSNGKLTVGTYNEVDGVNVADINIQLEEGTRTEYEPHKGTVSTIPTPNGLAGIKVSSGGNYTDENGQQWITDEIVKYADGSGKRIQRIFKETFSIDDNWESTTTQGRTAVRTPKKSLKTDYSWLGKISNIAANVYIGDSYCVFETSLSLEEFKTAISDLTVEVLQPLATPIITDLTAEEIAEIEKLHTFYPVTNISNDAGCNMTVKYLADAKNYIDNRLALIESAMINNI